MGGNYKRPKHSHASIVRCQYLMLLAMYGIQEDVLIRLVESGDEWAVGLSMSLTVQSEKAARFVEEVSNA